MVFDVSTDDFDTRVIGRSHELPVVVDFWAEWCGPCRQLGPALERAAGAREGEVELAKLDVDSNQALAAGFGIQGIPAVKAFRDGKVVDEFVGAQPPDRVEAFFERLVPSETDRLAASGDEDSLRRALELDPQNAEAARRLGRLLLERGDAEAASAVLEPVEGDFIADGLAARAQLATSTTEDGEARLTSAFAAWDGGDHAVALEALQEELAAAEDPQRRDLIRQVMVAIFTELGPADPLASAHRRRLATALN